MSCDFSVSDYSSFNIPEMEAIDYKLLFDFPYDSSSSSSSDYNLQALLNNNGSQQQQQNPDHMVFGFSRPSSPTEDQLENLNFQQTTQFQSLSFCRNPDSLNSLEVKNEESKLDFSSVYNDENVGYDYVPNLSSQNFQGQALSLPENNVFAGKTKNIFRNGDFENSFMEKLPEFKVGHYSQEERRERISKYRAKRNQRNYNKTIKYACRKTLADSRPRIRGRFARNDETAEIPKAACSTSDEHSYEKFPEVEDETKAKGTFMNSFSLHQFQYNRHGYF